MKCVLSYILLSFSYMAFAAQGDLFWQDFSEPKTVSLNFTSRQSADLAMFEEMYQRTQHELRQEMVQEAVDLLGAGASGSEAMQMILNFDDRVFDKRQISKYGIGPLIGKFFRSEMDAINESYEEEGGQRKIIFIDESYSSSPADYSVHIDWGAKSHSRLYAILRITNLHTGVSKSLATSVYSERLRTMGYMLASKLFHSLHRTRFPLVKKRGLDKVEFYQNKTITIGRYMTYRQKASLAQKYCKAKGLRLATADEMDEFFAFGYYHGGLALGSRKMGWAALKNTYSNMPTFINSEFPNGAPDGAKDIYLKINYICAKDIEFQYKF